MATKDPYRHLVFAELRGRSGNYHAAATRMPPRQTTLLHDHDFHEVFLVTGGSAMHQINRRPQPIDAGMLVFIRPSDRHCFQTTRFGLQIINVAFPVRWWRGFVALQQSPAAGAPGSGGLYGTVRLDAPHFAACRAAMEGLIAGGAHSACALLEACLTVDRCFRTAGGEPRRRAAPDWLEQLYRDMADPALAARDLHWWQARSGRSAEHLSRTCRKHYDATLTGLLNRFRIRHIQRRLRREPAKISTLALEGGFNNLGYFYRVFRRECGVTPRQWLRAAATVPISPTPPAK